MHKQSLFDIVNKDHTISHSPDSSIRKYNWMSSLTFVTMVFFNYSLFPCAYIFYISFGCEFVAILHLWAMYLIFKKKKFITKDFGISCLWNLKVSFLWNWYPFCVCTTSGRIYEIVKAPGDRVIVFIGNENTSSNSNFVF